MCFRIKVNKSGELDEVKVAKHAIVCYKVVSKGPRAKKTAKSYIQDYRYTVGKTARAKFDVQGFNIEAGLHSYRNISSASWARVSRNKDLRIMLCVIPKGAQYYQNRTEYCSTQLTPVAFI